MLIANYIYNIVTSGYYTEKDWKAWSDDEFLYKEVVEDWIIDLGMANDNEVYTVIRDKRIDEPYYEESKVCRADVIVGYHYLMYLENRLGLEELLNKMIEEDDTPQMSTIQDKINFWGLYCQFKEELDIEKVFTQDIHKIFETYLEFALFEKREIENYHNYVE